MKHEKHSYIIKLGQNIYNVSFNHLKFASQQDCKTKYDKQTNLNYPKGCMLQNVHTSRPKGAMIKCLKYQYFPTKFSIFIAATNR